MTEQKPSTRRHRRRLEKLEEARLSQQHQDQLRTAKASSRVTRRRALLEGVTRKRALAATLVAIGLSITVAVPAQMQWFLEQLTHGHWAFPGSLVAVVATLLIEGLCWLGAFLYADSVNTTPVRLYRGTTFAFASLAAWINFSHGAATDWKVGIVYALASLMGVGAWELYMHRTRHVASGMTADEIKLWALRWRKHPKAMREMGRIRATFGVQVPLEAAWRMAYVRTVGNPTVPIVLTDEILERLFLPDSTSTTETEQEAEQGGDQDAPSAPPGNLIEFPINWDGMHSAADVIDRYWPEVAEREAAEPTSPETRPSSTAARLTAPAEQATTSGNGARKRNSGGAKPSPTKAELTGTGDAKTRIRQYLLRVEARGEQIAELDRSFIASQFHVTPRYVRTAIQEHLSSKDSSNE